MGQGNKGDRGSKGTCSFGCSLIGRVGGLCVGASGAGGCLCSSGGRHAAGWPALAADVDGAPQERPRRDHHTVAQHPFTCSNQKPAR